mmetsp:Transcript_82674/g.164148  ORF Transcript_82674/g.164148 Transcript_82674/m.164148 type:complete len:217 (+) Transcript_82674:46-696(+)
MHLILLKLKSQSMNSKSSSFSVVTGGAVFETCAGTLPSAPAVGGHPLLLAAGVATGRLPWAGAVGGNTSGRKSAAGAAAVDAPFDASALVATLGEAAAVETQALSCELGDVVCCCSCCCCSCCRCFSNSARVFFGGSNNNVCSGAASHGSATPGNRSSARATRSAFSTQSEKSMPSDLSKSRSSLMLSLAISSLLVGLDRAGGFGFLEALKNIGSC